MANWFEYKLGREFVRSTFFNKEKGKWPPSIKQEFPKKPIRKIFCSHNNCIRIPTVYFKPDDDGPSGITDRLIMQYYVVSVCMNCGTISERKKEAEYAQPSRG